MSSTVSTLALRRYAILSVLDDVKPALARSNWVFARACMHLTMPEAEFAEAFGALLLDGEIAVHDQDGCGRPLYRRAEGRVTAKLLPDGTLAEPADQGLSCDEGAARHRARILELLRDGPLRSNKLMERVGMMCAPQMTKLTKTLARQGRIERVEPGNIYSGWQLRNHAAAEALPPPQPRRSAKKPSPQIRRPQGWLRESTLRALQTSAKRHCDLRAALGLSSHSMMTHTLGELARAGLIERTRPQDIRSPWQLTDAGQQAANGLAAAAEPTAPAALPGDAAATVITLPEATRFAVLNTGELHIETESLRLVIPPAITAALLNHLDNRSAPRVRA